MDEDIKGNLPVVEETEQERILFIRIEKIKTDLLNTYKSMLEQFFNFIKYKHYTLEGNKAEIKELDVFLDIYLCNILLSIYVSLSNLEELPDESLEIVKIVNALYGTGKQSIRSIINNFSKEEKKMIKEYPAYKANVNKLMEEYYSVNLLQDYNNKTYIN